jgi:acyl-CoA thioester hydrolase
MSSDHKGAAAAAATSAPPSMKLFAAPISVRWRDLDAFNHVNNANYLTFLEEARLQWFNQLPGAWLMPNCAPVMAASTVNYRRPIEWPAQLSIELFCAKVGNTSITVAHRMIDADTEALYCDGDVVLVWMNPETGRPVPLPSAIRDAAQAAAE